MAVGRFLQVLRFHWHEGSSQHLTCLMAAAGEGSLTSEGFIFVQLNMYLKKATCWNVFDFQHPCEHSLVSGHIHYQENGEGFSLNSRHSILVIIKKKKKKKNNGLLLDAILSVFDLKVLKRGQE